LGSGNVGSPEGFTARLRVEVGEQSTVELWATLVASDAVWSELELAGVSS